MKLKGRNAVVTGSSTGIGRAIALFLAKEGANVVVNARGMGPDGPGTNLTEINQVVDEIRAAGGTAIGCAGPVNDPVFAEKLIKTCVDEFGSIDILINNAGTLGMGTVDSCEHEHWHQVIDINLSGTFYCCQYASRYMKEQMFGRIVNCASDASEGVLGGSCYAASKAGVIGLSRAMARDLGMYGITVNVYNPCARTRMSDQTGPEYFEVMCKAMVQRNFWDEAYMRETLKMGRPDGIAPFVAYLCLDEANTINGRTFSLEGRRISLLYEPKREATLYRDYAQLGPWSLDELSESVPSTLGSYLHNAWSQKTPEEIAALLGGIDDVFL